MPEGEENPDLQGTEGLTKTEKESVPKAVQEALDRVAAEAKAAIDSVSAVASDLASRVGALETKGVGSEERHAESDELDDEPGFVEVENEVARTPLRILHDAIG